MAEEKREQRIRIGPFEVDLSDTIFIATLPALAYMLTFAYRSGYLGFFRIPTQFVSFRLGEVFTVIAALAVVGLLFLFAVDLVYTILPQRARMGALGGRLRYFLFLCFWLILTLLAFPELPMGLKAASLAAMLVLALAMFVLPLITVRGEGSYLEKLEAAEQAARRADQQVETLVDKLLQWIDPRLFFGIALALVLICAAWMLGRFSASSQREFHVANTSPEAVLLSITDDYVICCPFDRGTNEIEPGFLILKNGEDPNIIFQLEEIGPLHMKDIPVSATPSPTPLTTPP
jgi:hypothetical protein